MNTVKYKLKILLLLIISTSCSKEGNIETNCGPNGIPLVDSDECFCDFYYTGDNCDIELREKFIGSWTAYDHKCSFGDSIPDGFTVEIIKVDDVSKVKIISPELFTNDTIISNVDFLGFLRYWDFKLVGNQIRRTFDIEIYHEEESDELLVFIGRNEDLDEFTENCNCTLKRE